MDLCDTENFKLRMGFWFAHKNLDNYRVGGTETWKKWQ